MQIIAHIRSFITAVKIPLLSFFSLSTILNSLFYTLFSRAYDREFRSVLAGRIKYLKASSIGGLNIYHFRRNIHRLEKGLIMRPPSEIYALNYIEETVRMYCEIVRNSEGNTELLNEIIWGHDVLKEYFQLVASHPIIDKAGKSFISIPEKTLKGESPKIPKKVPFGNQDAVDFDSFLKLMENRHSVRWFLQKPVPREVIDRAVQAAVHSPNSCNRMPFRYHIFDEPELVQKIGGLVMGTEGYCDNIPVIAAVIGRHSAFFNEWDRHLIYIDSSLATMSFLLGLETQGIGSCCINWPDIRWREKKMKKLLKLEIDERVIMLIAIGYPDPEGMVTSSEKRNINSIRKYNLS